MISIYLLTKKNQFIFSISFVFNFQKSYLHLLYKKNLLQNFNLDPKIIFTCFYYKIMNFYNFIYKSILIHFHLKKTFFWTILLKINFRTTLFTKQFLDNFVKNNFLKILSKTILLDFSKCIFLNFYK